MSKNIHDALGEIVGMGLAPTAEKKTSPSREPIPKSPTPEPKSAIAPQKKKIAKRDSPHHTKTFLHLPNDIYDRLGVAAAKIRGKDKSDIVAEALGEWLDRQGL